MGARNNVQVGVVGATGAVGIEMLKVLDDKGFSNITAFASARSKGKVIEYGKEPAVLGKKSITCEEFTIEDAAKCSILLMAVSGTFAKENVPKLVEKNPGIIVIDNSSAFRYDPTIPLVVPEINAHAIMQSNIIANPNCTTAIAAMALHPIHEKYGIKRMIVSTYQAASGAGMEGVTELRDGMAAYPNQCPEAKVFAHQLMSNVIPHVDVFQENGYTKEEMKVAWETRKIFEDPKLKISCTAVRIPTERAHAEAITLELNNAFELNEVKEILKAAPGVQLVDVPEEKRYPMPLSAQEKYDVEVGRVRVNPVFDYGLDLFVCGDQLLRGAALNAVLIAEKVVERADESKKFVAAA